MPANLSDARLEANRRNGRKSTGPKTEAGKARSRANAVKHGLTGEGVALPVEDAAEVEQRFIAIQGDLAPATVLGVYFAHQIALMTVRCQRAARQETAALASRVRRASAEFEEARNAEADHLLGWIEGEPISYRRKLRATPEGVDRLIGALLGLKHDLDQSEVVWTFVHGQKIEAYFGRRASDIPHSRGSKLSKAITGDFSEIDPDEVADLATESERRNWACDQMVAHIEAEVERLRTHRAGLDHEAIALDRAEAGERAMFDPGKEATLARKYEAAAARNLYRALKEFRAVEATGAADSGDGIELAGPDEPLLKAGDSVAIASVGVAPDRGRKVKPNNDLERSLASFGTVASRDARGGDRGVKTAPSGPNQPLDQARAAARKRSG